MSQASIVIVSGMTCVHCVASVREEIGEVTGVSDVDVDLATGRVVVTSEKPVDGRAIQAAVEEAGYQVEPSESVS